MHHNLKIEDQYLTAIIEGKKTFEIRYNDRSFHVDDTVTLEGIESKTKVHATIGYVSSFQQQGGYVVFSLISVRIEETGTVEKDVLKPCPFCGVDPKYTKRSATETENSHTKEIHFLSCFCGGYSMTAHKFGYSFDDVTTKWNKRTPVELDKSNENHLQPISKSIPAGKFIALNSDGSGGSIYCKTDAGDYIDHHGDYDGYDYLSSMFAFWMPLPDSYEMFYEGGDEE